MSTRARPLRKWPGIYGRGIRWLAGEGGAGTLYIKSSSHRENGYVQSFNAEPQEERFIREV